jgi:hypothetical protein
MKLTNRWAGSMAKKSKSPLTKAKEKAWDEFSRFIRTRDCIKYGGSLTEGICVTCNTPYPFKKLQAGHFIAGRTNAILLDEDLCHTQCYGCNMGRSGAHVEYFVWMEKTYGREVIDIFRRRKSETLKMNEQDWLDQKTYWKKRTEALILAHSSDPYGERLRELISLGKTLTINT